MYTVKQLARLGGATVRMLHHYGKIRKLKLSSVSNNGYRYYGEEALYRLQQFLFYRELEIPLQKIKDLVSRPDSDVPWALEAHAPRCGRRRKESGA